MTLLLTFLLSTAPVRADERSWGVEGAVAADLLPCAEDLAGARPSNQATLAEAKTKARDKLAAIDRAAAEAEKPLRAMMAEIARAAHAAVTKHHREYEKAKDLRKLDYQRHLAILETIAAFDGKRPQYAMYQIERVIKSRHSLREYADCVDDHAADHDDANPAAH